jgi:hypothetical protein
MSNIVVPTSSGPRTIELQPFCTQHNVPLFSVRRFALCALRDKDASVEQLMSGIQAACVAFDLYGMNEIAIVRVLDRAERVIEESGEILARHVAGLDEHARTRVYRTLKRTPTQRSLYGLDSMIFVAANRHAMTIAESRAIGKALSNAFPETEYNDLYLVLDAFGALFDAEAITLTGALDLVSRMQTLVPDSMKRKPGWLFPDFDSPPLDVSRISTATLPNTDGSPDVTTNVRSEDGP